MVVHQHATTVLPTGFASWATCIKTMSCWLSHGTGANVQFCLAGVTAEYLQCQIWQWRPHCMNLSSVPCVVLLGSAFDAPRTALCANL